MSSSFDTMFLQHARQREHAIWRKGCGMQGCQGNAAASAGAVGTHLCMSCAPPASPRAVTLLLGVLAGFQDWRLSVSDLQAGVCVCGGGGAACANG
jgi:hypothetical protein